MSETSTLRPVSDLTATTSEVGQLWPTPTLRMSLPSPEAFNARLAAIILEEEAAIRRQHTPTTVAGIGDGLTAHWLNFNVLNWPHDEIVAFRRVVMAGAREWIRLIGDPDDPGLLIAGISCWANVLRYGERLTMHHHDPAFVSAHYTVQSGHEEEPPGCPDAGYTVYFRPGFADRSHGGDASMAASPWDDDWRIERPATPGHLFFFPSFVRHEVRPYLGRSQRISIAMDIFVKRQRLPIYFGGARWFVPE